MEDYFTAQMLMIMWLIQSNEQQMVNILMLEPSRCLYFATKMDGHIVLIKQMLDL